MTHPDSIRTYRITWRTFNASQSSEAGHPGTSHHAYTDEAASVRSLARSLRAAGYPDVTAYSWDKQAKGYTDMGL